MIRAAAHLLHILATGVLIADRPWSRLAATALMLPVIALHWLGIQLNAPTEDAE